MTLDLRHEDIADVPGVTIPDVGSQFDRNASNDPVPQIFIPPPTPANTRMSGINTGPAGIVDRVDTASMNCHAFPAAPSLLGDIMGAAKSFTNDLRDGAESLGLVSPRQQRAPVPVASLDVPIAPKTSMPVYHPTPRRMM